MVYPAFFRRNVLQHSTSSAHITRAKVSSDRCVIYLDEEFSLPVTISPTQSRGPGKKLVSTHLSNKRDEQGDSIKIISPSKIEFLQLGKKLATALSLDFQQTNRGIELMLRLNEEQRLHSGVKCLLQNRGDVVMMKCVFTSL